MFKLFKVFRFYFIGLVGFDIVDLRLSSLVRERTLSVVYARSWILFYDIDLVTDRKSREGLMLNYFLSFGFSGDLNMFSGFSTPLLVY